MIKNGKIKAMRFAFFPLRYGKDDGEGGTKGISMKWVLSYLHRKRLSDE